MKMSMPHQQSDSATGNIYRFSNSPKKISEDDRTCLNANETSKRKRLPIHCVIGKPTKLLSSSSSLSFRRHLGHICICFFMEISLHVVVSNSVYYDLF